MYKRKILSLLGATALMSSVALAATATANITPSASVAATCTITGNPMPFGVYNPLRAPQYTKTQQLRLPAPMG